VIRITSVEVLDGFRVRLGFTDETVGDVDLKPYLRGPVFEPLVRDRQLFKSVRVDPECQTIVWPNGADMDPDVLYDLTRPAHQRVHHILEHYEAQTDHDATAEDEAARQDAGNTWIEVPVDLVPEVRALIAKRRGR